MCVCVCVYYPSKLDGKSNYDEFSVKNLKQSVFSFPSRVTRNTKKKKKIQTTIIIVIVINIQ